MKKYLILALSLFAAQTLIAQHLPVIGRNIKPGTGLAENLTNLKDKEEITHISPTETTGQITGGTELNQNFLTESKVDRIAFDAAKGITLPGSTVAELLNQTSCSPFDLSSYEQLPVISTIQILINNQPSTIEATNVIAALNQVLVEQIKVIQINTSAAENPEAPGAVDITIYITQVK